ncbi:dihydrolipoyl dehydrogenase [Cytobacillus massiliigabonensis]|uniref:dihydrolipoyl dehydrogenase n=1 Tax=Cytobacillus massiliigabonensis TaxID=1871011 RepID=UPI000C860B00|nr:dihydrolipoyl dehydrogenase [Cytobacillus massiliigabonensis]
MVVGELAHERDLMIIGGGPGGYHAAIRAAQLGQTVTLIEKEALGGVCLNKGCIPSKVFTEGAAKLASLRKADQFGIESESIHFNLKKLQAHKVKMIHQLRKSIASLCKANKVELLNGSAFFLSEDRIGVENGDQYDVYRFKHAIIATGGSPTVNAKVEIDHERILNIWSMTNLEMIPEKLVIFGSDYIALEIAMAYHTFGSQVTLLIEQEDLLFDYSINRELKRVFKKNGINIIRNAVISAVSADENHVSIHLEKEEILTCTHMFVSKGQTPNVENLGINRMGIEMTESGFIQVNKQCQTSMPAIYAIGDVTEGPALAAKAIRQGKAAAEAIAGISTEVDFRFLPIAVHTLPPIASVGLTEQEAYEQGYQVNTGQFSLTSNGFAALRGERDGFIKVITDKESHLILGMHMIGYGAIELITSGVFTLEMAARDEDWLFPAYPHPSINESMLEAVEAIKKQSIHIMPEKERFPV